MRTASALTIRGCVLGDGWVMCAWLGECAFWGEGGMHAQRMCVGGVHTWGCDRLGDVHARLCMSRRSCMPMDGCAQGGLPEVCVWHICPPGSPPVNRITDVCENITFPQLRLLAVINHKYYQPMGSKLFHKPVTIGQN